MVRKNPMAFSDLFPMAARHRDRAEWTWPALLVAAALLSSFTFACVTPFAAFAVLTAATMGLRRALAMMVAVWLINQVLGFAALGYPFDGATLAWGGAIGIAAFGATVAVAICVRAVPTWSLWFRVVAGFVAAFIVYQAVLLSATAVLGGVQNFSADIVTKLVLSDAGWLIGIAILRHGLLRIGAISRPNRFAMRT
jgi:hypothetical protein